MADNIKVVVQFKEAMLRRPGLCKEFLAALQKGAEAMGLGISGEPNIETVDGKPVSAVVHYTGTTSTNLIMGALGEAAFNDVADKVQPDRKFSFVIDGPESIEAEKGNVFTVELQQQRL